MRLTPAQKQLARELLAELRNRPRRAIVWALTIPKARARARVEGLDRERDDIVVLSPGCHLGVALSGVDVDQYEAIGISRQDLWELRHDTAKGRALIEEWREVAAMARRGF